VWLLSRLRKPAGTRSRLTVLETLRRAEQRRREGRYAEARALVARALELDRDNVHAHLLAAYVHVARGESFAAQAEFRWVLAHDANHPRALLGLARLALEAGHGVTCRDLLRRALRAYPDFPEAEALLAAVHSRDETPPSVPSGAAAQPRVQALRLPGTGRALTVARADGALIAAQPMTNDATDVAEALVRMLRLAAAVVDRARLGALHRAIVDDGHDAVFTRTDGAIVVSLALPRATDPPQGLLDLNRLWSAALHELGVLATSRTAEPRVTAADVPAAPTRRVS